MPATLSTSAPAVPPPLHPEVLDRISVGNDSGTPMHRQLEGALRQAIAEHFEHGQVFWTEMLLMERLGISRFTVRQALSELAREGLIVRDAFKRTHVQKLGWNAVGVVYDYELSDSVNTLLQRLARQCAARELDFNLYHLNSSDGIAKLLPKLKRGPREERLVLFGNSMHEDGALFGDLVDLGYRCMALEVSGLTEVSTVRTDDRLAIRMALDHLTELGHRDICFLVNEPADRLPVAIKIDEYETEMRARGLEPHAVVCTHEAGSDSFEVAYRAMPELWDGPRRPTAIFTASDPGAMAVLRFAAERGVAVPGVLSVLGFEGVLTGRFTHPPLSSIGHDFESLARIALELLQSGQPVAQLIPPLIVERASTGPAPVPADGAGRTKLPAMATAGHDHG